MISTVQWSGATSICDGIIIIDQGSENKQVSISHIDISLTNAKARVCAKFSKLLSDVHKTNFKFVFNSSVGT